MIYDLLYHQVESFWSDTETRTHFQPSATVLNYVVGFSQVWNVSIPEENEPVPFLLFLLTSHRGTPCLWM